MIYVLALVLFLPLLYAGLTLIYLVQRRRRIARGLPPDAGSMPPEPPTPAHPSENTPDRPSKSPYFSPSTKPYGQKFAMQFAQWLGANRTLVRAHPYAACTGFHIDDDGTIVYGDYSDGYPFATLQRFPDLDSFAQWLARQSDQSLHKEGCECVSHSRLQKALRGQSYFGY